MHCNREKLLLHACCAPCLTYVLQYLSNDYHISVVFHNSNIYPEEEYKKRLTGVQWLCNFHGTELIVPAYDSPCWIQYIKGLEDEPEKGKRCDKCFRYRLEKTAETAVSMGFSVFTTTLSVSPHKDFQIINSTGLELGQKYAIRFLEGNFKKNDGYKKSCLLTRQYDLYRQKYCGCLYSMK